MKKLKKTFVIIALSISILILLTNQAVFASSIADMIQSVEYSEEFQEWLELSDEEKENVLQPRMYDILTTQTTSKSLLRRARATASSIKSIFSLKELIASNLSIRNQQQTGSCWTFATLSSLETNLALSNYYKGINLAKVYDYSERHMEYATSRVFANNEINTWGYNRSVGDGGTWNLAESYLTNGTGAIPESEMEFENNEDTINLSEIQNKTVSSQVYDTVYFANYNKQTDDTKTEIMNQIKQHIQNYGSVYAGLHGNSSTTDGYSCYNNDTGAKYCDNTTSHSYNHAVSIIGWDDNYSTENFANASRPTSNGAWIVRNSWGEDYGDNGFIYVSYEDCNIATDLWGIVKATDTVNYDNIYQYDEYYPSDVILVSNVSNIMLCNIFEKQTTGTEYLTQVALNTLETYTCKVYINPNGTSMAESDLQLVTLKAGESETINAGYHTLEFATPIEIKGDNFVVVIAIQGTNSNKITMQLESKLENLREEYGYEEYENVETESGKCFWTSGNDLSNCEWIDLGTLNTLNSTLNNADSTIKAFTTNKIVDNSLNSIEITTSPEKTEYFEGENFDKKGMVVTAKYNNDTSAILGDSSYNITNGTNLAIGQTSVTITYEDKSTTQTISVIKNSVTELKITTPPKKISYIEGENFDTTEMVVTATYMDGTTKTITDYTITDGKNLKKNQTQVTISYDEKTITQAITVTPNQLVELKVSNAPNKINYVVGQNFDKTGMIITGIYKDGTSKEITNYTIENGTNLTKTQTSVTIKYDEKTVTQAITVEEKQITGISINNKPSKLTYIQNKENLDLTGGSLKVTYNDGTSEDITLTSNEVKVTNFDNSKLGKNTVTVTYKEKTTQFDVEIIEEEKAENSNLDNANCEVKKVQAYYFTSNSKNDYVLVNVEINQISRNTNNDSVEYYYYLSSNSNENNITNWTKITEEQTSNNKLQFTVDTRNISNYNEIVNEDVLYIYVKEVAIKGGDQSVAITKTMELESDSDFETFVDNVKTDITVSNSDKVTDSTTATGELPQTGTKITLFIVIIILLNIVIILYIKNKILNKYVK